MCLICACRRQWLHASGELQCYPAMRRNAGRNIEFKVTASFGSISPFYQSISLVQSCWAQVMMCSSSWYPRYAAQQNQHRVELAVETVTTIFGISFRRSLTDATSRNHVDGSERLVVVRPAWLRRCSRYRNVLKSSANQIKVALGTWNAELGQGWKMRAVSFGVRASRTWGTIDKAPIGAIGGFER